MNKMPRKVITILNVGATIFFTKIREKPFLKTANSLPKDKEKLVPWPAKKRNDVQTVFWQNGKHEEFEEVKLQNILQPVTIFISPQTFL
jgi:hypothetical protein